ncbi:CLUMA_CG004276, isoform A [Clunio marinus]|uniref:CLUMA_CG004276, isoform A n=1 Tax=Clunio marinus TaxID=568069 RepID=A0A1J1HVP4_9DIPT|nr:CLUMA_CG004276, isoform A [Clunio marinus]
MASSSKIVKKVNNINKSESTIPERPFGNLNQDDENAEMEPILTQAIDAIEQAEWSEWSGVGKLEHTFSTLKNAKDLELHKLYKIKNITRVSSSCSATGAATMLHTDEFAMYLPVRFNLMPIPTSYNNKYFKIIGFKRCFGSNSTPLIDFITFIVIWVMKDVDTYLTCTTRIFYDMQIKNTSVTLTMMMGYT